MLTLSPMMVAPVCHVGDPLQLTCTASQAQFIKWRFLQQGTMEEITNSVNIDARDANQMKQILVHSATFTFTRTSARGALPLISTLSIDSVNIGLNGTAVQCTDVANIMISASTTIQVINISNSMQTRVQFLSQVVIIVHLFNFYDP